MRLAVRYLQDNPEKLKRLTKVRIWSGQWGAWWRPNGAGYTTCLVEAGIYDIADAWQRVSHVGGEKRLTLVGVRDAGN